MCSRDFVIKWKLVKWTVFLYLVQLVEPGYTTATSSSPYQDYSAARTVDGDVSQQMSRCLHTSAYPGLTEAWLRVDLRKTFSINSVKFWYRSDSKLYSGVFFFRFWQENIEKSKWKHILQFYSSIMFIFNKYTLWKYFQWCLIWFYENPADKTYFWYWTRNELPNL